MSCPCGKNSSPPVQTEGATPRLEARAVTGLAVLGGERWVPSGAGRTCPTDPKPEPPCQTTTGALNVLGDLPLTPAFGPSHTEASRNPVVWGTAQTALCRAAGTLDPRGFCLCAFAYSPSVRSASFMDRRRARRQLLVARRACSSRGQAR